MLWYLRQFWKWDQHVCKFYWLILSKCGGKSYKVRNNTFGSPLNIYCFLRIIAVGTWIDFVTFETIMKMSDMNSWWTGSFLRLYNFESFSFWQQVTCCLVSILYFCNLCCRISFHIELVSKLKAFTKCWGWKIYQYSGIYSRQKKWRVPFYVSLLRGCTKSRDVFVRIPCT